MHEINRRQFIATSAVAMVSALGAGSSLAYAAESSASKSGSAAASAASGSAASGSASGSASASAASAASASASGSAEVTTASLASDYDIVVIGMGGAGMCAAIAAKEAGVANVLIAEKGPIVGGNTNFSSSGMNASETKFQKDQKIDDSNDLFISDTMTGGHNWNNIDLVTYMCDNSAAGIDWLDAHGLTLDNITTTGGSSVARCHRPTDGSAVGASLVPALEAAVTAAGVEVIMNAPVTDILKSDDGVVCGIEFEDGTQVAAKAVIVATGGFGHNYDMIAEYRPDLVSYVSTNLETTTGDGMVMAQRAGANLIQMDQIQIHPTVYADGSLVAESLRGSGAILVNNAGDRFTDEMGTRDVVSAAELQQPDGQIWVVYDQTMYDANKACAKYEAKEMSVKADDLAGLATTLGIPGDELQATVDAYNASVANGGADDAFARTSGLGALSTAPFYAIPVYPGIHHCMGGIRIDTACEAMDILGNVIPGLYAAGETTGGVHGANRLGGNAVCDIVVNGINAGQNAATFIA